MREHVWAVLQDRMVEAFLLTYDHPLYCHPDFFAAFGITEEDLDRIIIEQSKGRAMAGLLGFTDHLPFRTMLLLMAHMTTDPHNTYLIEMHVRAIRSLQKQHRENNP